MSQSLLHFYEGTGLLLRSTEKQVGEGTTYFIQFLEDTESKKGCKLHKTARFRCCKLHKNDEDFPI